MLAGKCWRLGETGGGGNDSIDLFAVMLLRRSSTDGRRESAVGSGGAGSGSGEPAITDKRLPECEEIMAEDGAGGICVGDGVTTAACRAAPAFVMGVEGALSPPARAVDPNSGVACVTLVAGIIEPVVTVGTAPFGALETGVCGKLAC